MMMGHFFSTTTTQYINDQTTSTSSLASSIQRFHHIQSINMATVELQQFLGTGTHQQQHAQLEALREQGDPSYLFLRTILESVQHQDTSSTSPELLFHCISGTQYVALQNWTSGSRYHLEFVALLRDFFQGLGDFYGSSSLDPSSRRMLRNACYTTSVVFWKRGWKDFAKLNSSPSSSQPPVCAGEQTLIAQIHALQSRVSQTTVVKAAPELFSNIMSKLNLSDHTHDESVALYLSIMVQEFSGKSKTAYKLPMEFHQEAHRIFETGSAYSASREAVDTTRTFSPLDQTLQICMSGLAKVVSTASEPSAALAMLQLTQDVLGFEFGMSKFIHLPSSRTLIRPPKQWAEYLIKPEFVGAMFQYHQQQWTLAVSGSSATTSAEHISQSLRQLFVQLASLSGPIFSSKDEQQQFAHYLAQGSLGMLRLWQEQCHPDTHYVVFLDTLSLIGRMFTNYRLAMLSKLPSILEVLEAMTVTGCKVLQEMVHHSQSVHGDADQVLMELEWREDAIHLLLESVVVLSADPWIRQTRTDEEGRTIQTHLAQALGPLYIQTVESRCELGKLGEHFSMLRATQHGTQTDPEEAEEETSEAADIKTAAAEDEMTAVASLGRLHPSSALEFLATKLNSLLTNLQRLWNDPAPTTPEACADSASLLEEARLLLKYTNYLLTDPSKQLVRLPKIPGAIDLACQREPSVVEHVATTVRIVLTLAEAQASRLPILDATSNIIVDRIGTNLVIEVLEFLERFAPVYLFSAAGNSSESILAQFWSQQEASDQVVAFCLNLSLQYGAYLPDHRAIQDHLNTLLLNLAKRNAKIRNSMVSSEPFQKLAKLLCLMMQYASAPHPPVSLPEEERLLLAGFQRHDSSEKKALLTSLILASSDAPGQAIFVEILSSLNALTQSVISFKLPLDPSMHQAICTALDLCSGVAEAKDIDNPQRLISFLDPILVPLTEFSSDQSICDKSGKLLRDYVEHLGERLTPDQQRTVNMACANVLRAYPMCHDPGHLKSEGGEESLLVLLDLLLKLSVSQGFSEAAFYGLQQVLPIMSMEVLHRPAISSKFFSLITSSLEKSPERLNNVSFELLNSILQCILFGMTVNDIGTAKDCLVSSCHHFALIVE